MRDNAAAMGTADYAHATIIRRAVTERQPRCGIFQFVQTDIKPVLMPGNISRVTRTLPEHCAGMDQNVRTKNVFNSIEHSGMQDQVLHPTMEELQVPQPSS